jgi:hypothetical protein
MIGAKIKPMFEAEARKNQGTRTDLWDNCPKSLNPIHSAQKAAEVVNVSDKSIKRADPCRHHVPFFSAGCTFGPEAGSFVPGLDSVCQGQVLNTAP